MNKSKSGSRMIRDLGLVGLLVFVATLLRALLSPVLGQGVPFILYFPAVALMAWYCNRSATAIGVVLSALTSLYFFIPPRGSFDLSEPQTLIQILVFVVGSSAIAMVVSRLRSANETIAALREAEAAQSELIRVTLNSIGDGVIAADTGSRVSFINRVAQEMTGFSEADARDRVLESVFRIVNETSRETVENPVAKVLEHGRIVGLANHTVLISRDGTETPIADSAAPIKGSNGEIKGVVLVFRDASDERHKEHLMREALDARQSAEQANRSKDDFLATVSHELRAPLNAILGWAEVIGKSSRPEQIQRGVDIIRQNVQNQAALINDMLDISAIASGKFGVELKPVSLASLVQQTFEAARPLAEKNDMEFVLKIEEGDGLISGDAVRLRQVLWNLYTNAIKFTSAGRITTQLAYHDELVCLSVMDTGKGIAPEFLPFVFDRFRQADPSIRRREGGLGLGLSIVQRIVELHGGTVEAFSAGEGQGTTMTLKLPLQDRSRSDPEVPASAATKASSQTPADGLKGRRILVVDDDLSSSLLLQEALLSHEARVQVGATAIEALKIFDDWNPDALISDIGMPGFDGYWLLERIREREKAKSSPPIPAIALTAYNRSMDRERAFAAGYTLHLEKPASPDSVVTALTGLVERTQQ